MSPLPVPTAPLPIGRRPFPGVLLVLALALGFWAPGASAQEIVSRQVTVFGIRAIPHSTALDRKLEPIAPQLRSLFPGYGFELLGTETKRITSGQTLRCDLSGDFSVGAQLLNPYDPVSGKTQLRFQLDRNDQLEFATLVNTPLNQLFFCDKKLTDGTRLLIGVAVRE